MNRSPCSLLQTTDAGSFVGSLQNVSRLQICLIVFLGLWPKILDMI